MFFIIVQIILFYVNIGAIDGDGVHVISRFMIFLAAHHSILIRAIRSHYRGAK